MPRRTTIEAAKKSLSQGRGGRVTLAGRALAWDPAAEKLLLGDASGTLEVRIDPRGSLTAGDWIEVQGTAGRGGLSAESLKVLTPCRAAKPFPSPGGEHYRLHRVDPSGQQRISNLRRRARCLAAIRGFFDQRGFLEVQTPHVVCCPGLEPHLRAVPAGSGRFLITSPEYQMKRLLAGGLERIYFLGPCWRGDEIGAHHLGEFCMLEWYEAFASIEQLMEQTEALLEHLARELAGDTRISYQGQTLRLEAPFARITVAEAFRRYAGVDLAGVTTPQQLAARAEQAGFGPFAGDERYEDLASRILVERVEPAMGSEPTFLYDFPAPLAALSRLRPDDSTVAERFELYIGGLELANAFGELTAPDEQLARLQGDQRARQQAGAPVHPIDARFIAALEEGIPPTSGIALGVDRLVMLFCDAAEIGQVVAFAPDEV